MSTSEDHTPAWKKYIDEHSPRSVAVIRDKGFSVWSLVRYYRICRGDKAEMLDSYRGELTGEELDAALAHYWAKPYDIDQKLKELSEGDEGPPIYDGADGMDSQQKGEQPWRKHIDENSRRSVAVIRDKGMPVWSLIRYHRIHRGDKERTLTAYHGDLTSEELDAALAYYWANPYDIDRKLEEIST